MMKMASKKELLEWVEQQLSVWPDAAARYDGLSATERTVFRTGTVPVAVQFNPARAKSTEAKVDAASIESRPCFLCAANRPECQLVSDLLPGWDILVNPYPIFPLHLTIASQHHEDQGAVPLDMLTFAAMIPGVAAFYNGARAGASAPDHLHFQAISKEELPLLAALENFHDSKKGNMALSGNILPDYPAAFWSFIITPDANGQKALSLLANLKGEDADTGELSHKLVNVFFWLDNEGLIRAVVFPRKRHRPIDYNSPDGLKISPGAIDIAGIMISSRLQDFDRICKADVERIFREVSFSHKELIPLTAKIFSR